ncbi:hypothetical protein JTF06_02605 [Desemzia sp. RIT804]|uniref:hypothetical protein n=1 Tax=Desemzia sp. RIT 804 TaxID=2810209 RepID=UPI001950A4EA|nr:hypothetical protein [Desemzia sp. RIT 804]MBM6613783.1 hypothetical protein [Desemzia sp. RIT 804]
MQKEMTALQLFFRNGDTLVINREFIGDLWIKQVTTSYGRINGSDFQEIHPCQSFKIELLPEADRVDSDDINLGGLESGMFERIKKYSDIETMDLLYKTPTDPDSEAIQSERIYFPYEAQDPDGLDNKHQSTHMGADGHLYVLIDPEKTVTDVFPNLN